MVGLSRWACAAALALEACGRSLVDLDGGGSGSSGDDDDGDERGDDAATVTITDGPTGDPTTDPTGPVMTTPADGGVDGEGEDGDPTDADSTGAGETAGGETAGGEASSTTTSGGVGCSEPVAIELAAEDAILSGDWTLVESMFGEGTVAAIDDSAFDPAGTVHWDIDVPCDGDWFVWVRGTDFGQEDSFFARLDGEPEPAPIFEIDCDFDGQSYAWRVLNWRDPDAGMPCEYVEDPWIAEWSAGPHTFELDFREAIAVARIVVTNDPAFVP